MGSSTAQYPALKGLYSLRETIGSGGFAKVKKAIHLLTGEKCAIKIMDKKGLGDDLPRVYLEIEAMKDLSHQNIAKLFQVIETTTTIFMVIEYCPGGELFDYIVAKNKLPEDEARVFFRQIVTAVGYIHKRGYAHRDLKPENLLLDKDHRAKLIDFGLCAKPQGGMENVLKTCCGSPAYAAPELVNGQEYLGAEADLWSMGVLLYALLCGYLPFDDDNISNLYRKIKAGRYVVPDWVSEESSQLISQLLQVDPKRRITIEQLMEHPWLCKYDGKVSSASNISHTLIDPDCCGELSIYYGKSLKEMSLKIREWKYEYLTASYLLLQHRKASGRSIRLAASHAPRAPLGEMKPRCILGESTASVVNAGLQRNALNNKRENNANDKDDTNGAPPIPEKQQLQQPKIMTPTGATTASPRIARNQVQRHSARPTYTSPAIPPRTTPTTSILQQQQQKQQQPPRPLSQPSQLPVYTQSAPGAPKLPPKNPNARLPSTSEESDGGKTGNNDDKENFAIPIGRASRANKTPHNNRVNRPQRGSQSQPRPRPPSLAIDDGEGGFRSVSSTREQRQRQQQRQQQSPKPIVGRLDFDEPNCLAKQIIPRRLSEDGSSPTDEPPPSSLPTSAPTTPTTPSKPFALPLNPFLRNVTPSKSLDSGLDEVDADGVSARTASPRTPSTRVIRRRSNSIDTSQMPQRNDEILWTPGSATKTPMSTARPQNSVFGSIERGLDKMKAALTPRKRLGSDFDGAPRRINALINLTYTSQNSADAVVDELRRALDEKNIPFKQIDYLLRCKISDDWGRIRLAFDLEVCEMPSRGSENRVGIRRKRVKGDTWMFKRYCEDILDSAVL